MSSNLRGSFPPLVTPFRGGAVDYEAFARLVEWPLCVSNWPASRVRMFALSGPLIAPLIATQLSDP